MFYNGRSVAIESMHGGIEPSIIASKLAHADIAGRVAELRQAYQGRYVFVGIDKVQHVPRPPLVGFVLHPSYDNVFVFFYCS